jgi:hypothetical protein
MTTPTLSRPTLTHALAAAALLAACPALAQTTLIPLNPRATYLRTNQDSPALPNIRTLASLSLAAGDRVRFRVLGEFVYIANGTTTSSASAVFSSSSTILAATGIVQRVPDAIDAGIDFVTGNTYHGGVATDIPQDFRIGDATGSLDVEVVIPAGATHLFLGVPDSLYNDNNDTDGDFAIEVSLACAQNRCCGTSDFNGDGDFGTDQDIEAFFACLAGNCCPSCFEGGSDFNGDGDFGTDQDIEAFFRVLAGGNC